MLHLKANALMKANIDTLLRARGQSRRDLAQWCRRTDAWIGKIMAEDHREFPMKYFDRIADFFGIATYQLLQPGISPLTERRKAGERRTGQDRRLSRAFPSAQAPSQGELAARFAGLDANERRKVEAWIEALMLSRGGSSAPARRLDPPASPEAPARETRRRRAAGESA